MFLSNTVVIAFTLKSFRITNRYIVNIEMGKVFSSSINFITVSTVKQSRLARNLSKWKPMNKLNQILLSSTSGISEIRNVIGKLNGTYNLRCDSKSRNTANLLAEMQPTAHGLIETLLKTDLDIRPHSQIGSKEFQRILQL